MFGVSYKLNDASLYSLHDMVEGQIQQSRHLLTQCAPDQNGEIARLKAQIAYYEHEMSEFEKDVARQREELFQFSIEELYFMYGQYEDRFIGIEFHKLSESARKFGREIGGVIVYSKSEREKLDALINSGSVTRTNGVVKIETSSNYDLSDEQRKVLLEKGFISGDIFQIFTVNLNVQKAFKKEGRKEIPNTINIEFDPTGMDPLRISKWLFTQRIKDGGKLIDTEWRQLCGYSLHYEPESINLDYIKQYVYDDKGNKDKRVRFYELNARLFNNIITEEEITEFGTLLRARNIERMEMIKEEVKRSTNKSIEKFVKEYPLIYKTLIVIATTFEEETLEHHKTFLPIYWDFKSFVHIYLRHYEELQIEGHFKNKTKFQYTQKDIKRILEIAIRKLHDKINDRLIKGLDYRVFGDYSLYFNGNYYAMRIEKNGRVDSFYPMETKSQ